jgi:hypothetical protein
MAVRASWRRRLQQQQAGLQLLVWRCTTPHLISISSAAQQIMQGATTTTGAAASLTILTKHAL